MKIRILRPFETSKGRLVKGQVLDVTPAVAERWVDLGDAEMVREPYVKQPKQNKIVKPTENKGE